MEKGDKIIWDSGFGYEIGYFIKESDITLYNSYCVNLVTGIVKCKVSLSKNEIIPYTEENLNKMKEKYIINCYF